MQTVLSSTPPPRKHRAQDRWAVPLAGQLLERARIEERVAIARQTLEIPNGYGGFHQRLGRCPKPWSFAWGDRDEPFELLAVGAVHHARSWGAAATLEHSSVTVEPRSDAELPLWVGGAAFAGGNTPGGLWTGWPAQALWVPRFMLVARGGRRWLVSHVRLEREAPEAIAALRLESERRRAEEWYRDRPRPAQPMPALLPPSPDETRDDWLGRVEQTVESIAAGRARKVVLARAADVVGDKVHVGATLGALRAAHPRTFCFAVRTNAPSTFVGATPELLVRRRDGRFLSEALAGTVAGGGTDSAEEAAAQRLLESHKDRHEHGLVVQHIVDTLRQFGESVRHAAEPQVISAGRVLHLRTAAEARAGVGVALADVVAALHPTPAVGGLPVAEALEQLRAETLERGWYAAPVGWMDARGDGVFAVALRSALLHEDGARLFAGAGIVEGSQPQAEWKETELKLGAMREALRFDAGVEVG